MGFIDKVKRFLPGRRSREPLGTLRQEIDRVFNRFLADPFRVDLLAGERSWPAFDVSETDHEFVIEAEVPGLGPEDLDVSVTEDGVVIRGEKRAEREERRRGYHRIERQYGGFYRMVPLPADVDVEKTTATCKKGTLMIRVPKTGRDRPGVRRIAVST